MRNPFRKAQKNVKPVPEQDLIKTIGDLFLKKAAKEKNIAKAEDGTEPFTKAEKLELAKKTFRIYSN